MKLCPIVAVAALLALPLPAVAAPPTGGHHGDARAHSQNNRHHHTHRHGKARDARVDHAVGCPPGLAKKSPACVPPGQAKKHVAPRHDRGPVVRVGQRLDWDTVRLVRDPSRYGLPPARAGERYAIADGRLLRVDAQTHRVLDIIRVLNR